MVSPDGRPPEEGNVFQSRNRYEEKNGEDVGSDLMNIISEHRDIGKAEDDTRHGRPLLVAGLLIGLAVVGAAGWYLLTGPNIPDGQIAAPTIPADTQPYKVRPADPGGMQVPDQDKTVYQRIDSDESSRNSPPGTVEKLLPDAPLPQAPPIIAETPPAPDIPLPAAPRPPSVVASGSDVPSPPNPITGEKTSTEGKSAVSPPNVITGVAKPDPGSLVSDTASSHETKASSDNGIASLAPKAPDVHSSSKSPVVVPPAPRTGPYMIQLGALGDEAAAKKAWNSLKEKYPDLLGSLTPQIERADLKEKGIFYRLRAGGIADEKTARSLCDELAKKNVGCLFVGK